MAPLLKAMIRTSRLKKDTHVRAILRAATACVVSYFEALFRGNCLARGFPQSGRDISMMKAALVFAALALSGCASGAGIVPQATGAASSQNKEDDGQTYLERQRCQSTSEGTDARTVCY